MLNWKITISAVAIVAAAAIAVAQQREKKKGPPDFKAEVAAASSAFDAKKFGACSKHMRRAMTAVIMLRRQQVLAAFPEMGADWKVKESRGYEEALTNPMMSIIPVNLAGTIERSYTSGNKRIKVTLTMDSPLAKTFGAMVGMMRGPDTEVITYTGNKALLKKQGSSGLELTMVLAGAHSLVANCRNVSDDELLKMFSQENLDRIGAALQD